MLCSGSQLGSTTLWADSSDKQIANVEGASSTDLLSDHSTVSTPQPEPSGSSQTSFSKHCPVRLPDNHRLVVSPSSSHASSHFQSVEVNVESEPSAVLRAALGSESRYSRSGPAVFARPSKGTPDSVMTQSTCSTINSPGEQLLKLSDSFPEKLVMLTSPELTSPTESWLEFSSSSSNEETPDGQNIHSTFSLNEILERQSMVDESFDDVGFDGTYAQKTATNRSLQEKIRPPPTKLPLIRPRSCLIQRPTSLELLSNNSKFTHVTDEYLLDSSSSNSSRTHVECSRVHTESMRKSMNESGRMRSHRTSNKKRSKQHASPTVYHHLNRMTLAEPSTELDEVTQSSQRNGLVEDILSEERTSSTSHSPQSLSSVITTSNSQTPLSYGSPPLDYCAATAADSHVVHAERVLTSGSSPDSALQHSFSSASSNSSSGVPPGSAEVASPLQRHVIKQPETQYQHSRDDGYASNSTTSVSLNDLQQRTASSKPENLDPVDEMPSRSMESSPLNVQQLTHPEPRVQGSQKESCSDSIPSIESSHIGSVRDIRAYFEGKFETQHIKLDPSPIIRMPPKLETKPKTSQNRSRLQRSLSDSHMVVSLNKVERGTRLSKSAHCRPHWLSLSTLKHPTNMPSPATVVKQLKDDSVCLQLRFARRPSLLMDRSGRMEKKRATIPDMVSNFESSELFLSKYPPHYF